MLKRAITIALTGNLAGCAIHPTPQDQTKLRTDVIVQRIRCETRDALRKELVWYLTEKSSHKAAKSIGRRLSDPAQPISVSEINALADPRIETFRGSGIAYSFSFDMTEVNNFGGGMNAIKPLDNGKHLFGFGAGTDRKRRAIRSFTVTDGFEKLLTQVDPKYCTGEAPPPNYIYPIAGRIGVEEMVQAFTNLAVTSTLVGKEEGPPTMVDTFEFTTKISASVTPKLELNPVRNTIRFADGFLTAEATREDIHQVVIGFALPVVAAVPEKGKKKAGARNLMMMNLITAKGNNTEAAAATAVDQHILRFEVLPRRGI